MTIRTLNMQHNNNLNMNIQQPQPLNLTLYTTPYYENNGSQYNDLDPVYSFDETIEGAADNYSDLYCPSFSYENKTYLNVSCDAALSFSVPLYGSIAPFFILITLIANSAIVVVLSKKNMQTPTNAVLLGMAICDFVTILFPAPGLIYMYTFERHSRPLGPVSFCYIYYFFNETLPSLFHTCSIWLTVALAFQRFIYVCHPPLARVFLTMPKVRRSICYIFIAAVIHQTTRFFDTVYVPVEIMWEGEKHFACHQQQADWVVNYVGEDYYFTFYYMFRVIFVHLLPCIMLILLNILLFRAMRVAQQKRQKLFDKCYKKSKRANDKNCTTLMLIIVVSVFLIVEIPLAIITALHVISSLFINFLDYRIANLCILFANFFLILSYPVNFALYCGMSRQFRETFKEIFWKRSLTVNGNNVTTIMGGSRKQHEMSSRYSLVNVNGPKTNTTNETVL